MLLGPIGFRLSTAVAGLLCLMLSANTSYAVFSPPQYFITIDTFDKNSGQHISGPFTLQIEIRNGDQVLNAYDALLNGSPKKIFVNWYETEYPKESKVFLTVTKEGYKESEVYSHDLYFSAQEGTTEVFSADFQLERDPSYQEEPLFIATHIVEEENSRFEILTESEIEGISLSFDKEIKQIAMSFPATLAEGNLRVTIPKELLGGPFAMTINNVIVLQSAQTSNDTHTAITLTLDRGSSEVVIQGTTAIPEMPFPQLAAIIGISMTIIVTILVMARRLPKRLF